MHTLWCVINIKAMTQTGRSGAKVCTLSQWFMLFYCWCSGTRARKKSETGAGFARGAACWEKATAGWDDYGWHGMKPCWWNLPWSGGFRHATWWNECGVWGGVREEGELSSTEKKTFSRQCNNNNWLKLPFCKKCKNCLFRRGICSFFPSLPGTMDVFAC